MARPFVPSAQECPADTPYERISGSLAVIMGYHPLPPPSSPLDPRWPPGINDRRCGAWKDRTRTGRAVNRAGHARRGRVEWLVVGEVMVTLTSRRGAHFSHFLDAVRRCSLSRHSLQDSGAARPSKATQPITASSQRHPSFSSSTSRLLDVELQKLAQRLPAYRTGDSFHELVRTGSSTVPFRNRSISHPALFPNSAEIGLHRLRRPRAAMGRDVYSPPACQQLRPRPARRLSLQHDP